MLDDIKPPPKNNFASNQIQVQDDSEKPVEASPSLVVEQSKALGRRILCIEDEPFIGDLYKRAFEKAGYQTEIIADGIEGLDRAKSNDFDIILLDIMIPQILGIDVLHELRKEVDLKAKIIIATNLEQDDETRAKIEKEADAYVIKAEITPSELVEFLKNF